METVLVTGAAGYIGSHTCVELILSGYNVVGIDNFVNSSKDTIERIEKITKGKVKFYEGDLRDRLFLENLFSENKIDVVIHFAGLKAVGESCKIPLEYYNNNLYGTIVLLEVMKKFDVNRFIFSSSATVYGNNKPPYNEDMPTGDVTNPYGQTKHMIEKILFDVSMANKDLSVIILRYFNPIGAHESGLIGESPRGIPNNLMPYILKVATGELPELRVFGNDYNTPDGTCIRDYIHVVDLANGHVSAIKKGRSVKGVCVYNLGTGKGTSVLDLIKTFEEVSKVKVNKKVVGRREGDVPVCFADVTKANKELLWVAKRSLRQMCEDSWRWARVGN